MPKTLKLEAEIQIVGINPYVLISSKQAEQLRLGWRKPLPVIVNGPTDTKWQTYMMPTGQGDFYLYLHGDMRKVSKTKVGEHVTINIEFDEGYHNGPLHQMPDWFRAALNNNPAASSNWQALSPSRQKEILRYFYGLKTDEAQERNLRRAINVLEGNRGHFMGRDWKHGK